MWFGWLVGRCYFVWVVGGALLCSLGGCWGVAMWRGCCYVVWVVAGALLCGVGVARVLVWVVGGALLCGVGVARVLLCSLGGCWGVASGVGVAMWFGWLLGHCYVAWVLLGCCYVVWVVGGALLCGVGVARVLCSLGGCWALLCGVVLLCGFGWLLGHCYVWRGVARVYDVVWVVGGALLCGLGDCWGIAMWRGCCYVVWVVGGALLCGVGVARVLAMFVWVVGGWALLCGL